MGGIEVKFAPTGPVLTTSVRDNASPHWNILRREYKKASDPTHYSNVNFESPPPQIEKNLNCGKKWELVCGISLNPVLQSVDLRVNSIPVWYPVVVL